MNIAEQKPVMNTNKKTLRHRVQHREATAWHIGGLIAAYNTLMIIAIALLAFLSLDFFPFWVFLLVVTPIFLAAFWFWMTQRLLQWYERFLLHEVYVIAKISILPFLALFIACALYMVAVWERPEVASVWKIMAYEGVLFGIGCTFVGLTVLVFGLRHRIRISALR